MCYRKGHINHMEFISKETALCIHFAYVKGVASWNAHMLCSLLSLIATYSALLNG